MNQNEREQRIKLERLAGERDDLILRTDRNVPVLVSSDFRNLKGIRAGFSTRLGGVSEGYLASLNLGLTLGDETDHLKENYRRFADALSLDADRISCPDQVHDDRILIATEKDAGDGINRERTHFRIDAQITEIPELPLIVYAADCVPILFADPVRRVVGTAHAGWRGSVSGIAAKVVRKMAETFGCREENVHAMIGPSAGPEGYEVDHTVRDAVLSCSFLEDAGECLRPSADPEHWMLDLWMLNRKILCAAGVPEEQISCIGLSTLAYPDIFFSHRRSNGKRGLNAGMVAIAPDGD